MWKNKFCVEMNYRSLYSLVTCCTLLQGRRQCFCCCGFYYTLNVVSTVYTTVTTIREVSSSDFGTSTRVPGTKNGWPWVGAPSQNFKRGINMNLKERIELLIGLCETNCIGDIDTFNLIIVTQWTD